MRTAKPSRDSLKPLEDLLSDALNMAVVTEVFLESALGYDQAEKWHGYRRYLLTDQQVEAVFFLVLRLGHLVSEAREAYQAEAASEAASR